MGWWVHPCKPEDKSPYLNNGAHGASTKLDTIQKWWLRWPDALIGIATGPSGLIVIDLDVKDGKDGVATWTALGGDLTAARHRTPSGGYHLVYRRSPDLTFTERNNWRPGIDIKAATGYVIAPPSTGYQLVEDWTFTDPPGWLLDLLAKPAPKPRANWDELTGLLNQEGFRNDAWVKLCGSLARLNRRNLDSYTTAWQARAVPEEYGGESHDRLEAAAKRIWGYEQEKVTQEPGPDEGWLSGMDGRLYTVIGKDDKAHKAECSNFDPIVKRIGISDDIRLWEVDIHGDDHLLLASTLTGPRFQEWLAVRGLILWQQGGQPGEYARVPMHTRLAAYLNSQAAPEVPVVTWLGDHGVSFVHHGGVFGPGEYMCHPRLKNWAPFNYGTVDEDTALGLLREVLTWQEPEVAAVFGAWWAACFIKGQIKARSSLFPIMAIQGASEAGKTNGFFDAMTRLNGSKLGPGGYTGAALRDYSSANRNGIVWTDDQDNIDPELLRKATSEESMSFKGPDKLTQEVRNILAPLVISGEAFFMLDEKAMQDRCVVLAPTSPKDRMVNGRLQWDDVLETYAAWDRDFSQVAGTLAQIARRQVGLVAQLRDLRVGSGRHGEKLAVLRVGARVLAAMVEDETWVELVDAWCGAQHPTENADVLVNRWIPAALREAVRTYAGMPKNAIGAPTVFVDEGGRVWFSEGFLVDWLERKERSRWGGASTLHQAVREQVRSLGGMERKRMWTTRRDKAGTRGSQHTYVGLTRVLSERVLDGIWCDPGCTPETLDISDGTATGATGATVPRLDL